MRERLTVWFTLLTLVVVAGSLAVRAHSLGGDLRALEGADLRQDARLVQAAIDARVGLDEPVDDAFLADLTGPDRQLVWVGPDGDDARATGRGFDAGRSAGDPLVAAARAGGGRVTLTESGAVVDSVVESDRRSILVLLLLVCVIAGATAWLVARRLSAPFRRLAVAADLLGRGRFDLDLPRNRMPEVRAISQALHGSAGRLQERLSREQEFAEHASHVLRTPLTGLRMELEELSLRDDLPTDAQGTVVRSLDRIDSMNVVAGELVQLSRGGALVAGAELALRELATQCAQRWADTLAEHDRPLTAAVEGNLDTTYTPGPVEHILDLLLVDVLRRGSGPVRMVFDSGVDANLKITITSSGELRHNRGPGSEVPITQARAVVTALGGRLVGEDPADGLEILLPRR